jgi:hypothetical protein
MPIPAASTARKPRAAGADGTTEPAPTTSARPWRNALVRRVEPGGEAPTSAPPVVARPVDAPNAAPAPTPDREPEQRPALPREAEAPSGAPEEARPVVAEGVVETPEPGKTDRVTAPAVRQAEPERAPKPQPVPPAVPTEPAPAAPVIPEPEPEPSRSPSRNRSLPHRPSPSPGARTRTDPGEGASTYRRGIAAGAFEAECSARVNGRAGARARATACRDTSPHRRAACGARGPRDAASRAERGEGTARRFEGIGF